MKTILHILTRPEDPLADTLIAVQQTLPDMAVEAFRLGETTPPEQYRGLVEKVFSADSVQVW